VLVVVLIVLSIGLLAPAALWAQAVVSAVRTRDPWVPFLRRPDGAYPLLVRGRRTRGLALTHPGRRSRLVARWGFVTALAALGIALASWLWLGPGRTLGVGA